MPKVFTSKTQQIGEVGENIAVQYIQNKGFTIIERNFTSKVGEIDIIAFSHETYHFIEVKTVTREKMEKYNWKPEQNLHAKKIEKMIKTVELYRSQHREVLHMKLILISVVLDQQTRKASVSLETIT
jgi:putative endonuclease